MRYYPTLKQLLDYQAQNGNEALLEINRSMRSILSNLVWFLLAVIGVYTLNFYFRAPIQIPGLGAVSLRWLAIIPVGILLEAFRKHKNELYVLEPTRILQVSGRISLNYNVPAASYSDIRGVTVEQDLIGRLLGYGTVYVGTAAEGGSELVLFGVRRPKELAELIDELRDYSISHPISTPDNNQIPQSAANES